MEKSQALASIHVQIDPTKLPLLFIKTDLPNAMRCNFTSSGCTRHYFIVAKKTFAKSRKKPIKNQGKSLKTKTHFSYKRHFYKERQAEIGKKSSKSSARH